MTLARNIKPATLSFILSGTGPLDSEASLLALVAACAADGHRSQCQTVLHYSLGQEMPRAKLRAAILLTAGFAGLPRVEMALAALRSAEQDFERPSDPLAAILSPPGHSQGQDCSEDVGEVVTLSPAEWEQAGNRLLVTLHGGEAARVSSGLGDLAPELVRWTRLEYGRAFGGGDLLSLRTRVVLVVAALVPLDAPVPLERFVRLLQGRGVDADGAWALLDLVAHLFQDGPVMKQARGAFEAALGRRSDDDGGIPGGGDDPYRWD